MIRDQLKVQELMDVRLDQRDEELHQFWSQSQADGAQLAALSLQVQELISSVEARVEVVEKDLEEINGWFVSRIRILTSKITQVCQDIRDIKLRRLLITRSDNKPNDITNRILTNQNDCKNTSGSSRSRPDPPGTHEDRAEGGSDYVYRTPNLLEHDIPNNQEDHGRCPPQPVVLNRNLKNVRDVPRFDLRLFSRLV